MTHSIGSVVTLTDTTFHAEVLESSTPVLVDFWAAWCGPCRVMNPVISAIADAFVGQVKVAKLNIDEYPDLTGEYGIQALPTLLLFKNGRVVDTIVGVTSKAALADRLHPHLSDIAA